MTITVDHVAQELTDYLQQRASLAQVVDWAEAAMLDGEFDEREASVITPIIARLGLADVREFGVAWDDCYNFLTRLGYRINVSVSKAV